MTSGVTGVLFFFFPGCIGVVPCCCAYQCARRWSCLGRLVSFLLAGWTCSGVFYVHAHVDVFSADLRYCRLFFSFPTDWPALTCLSPSGFVALFFGGGTIDVCPRLPGRDVLSDSKPFFPDFSSADPPQSCRTLFFSPCRVLRRFG